MGVADKIIKEYVEFREEEELYYDLVAKMPYLPDPNYRPPVGFKAKAIDRAGDVKYHVKRFFSNPHTVHPDRTLHPDYKHPDTHGPAVPKGVRLPRKPKAHRIAVKMHMKRKKAIWDKEVTRASRQTSINTRANANYGGYFDGA